jgi:endo-alpha-1,4-polygalactosaminidase (GH114 family)
MRITTHILIALILFLSACDASNLTPEYVITPPVTKTTTLIPSTPWQWQLTGTIDTSIQASLYDIALFDADPSIIMELKAGGATMICYVNVGAWEDWRPDADQFPKDVIKNDYAGWEGEKWLDIRQIDELAPIIEARFDLCKQKGFDGIEPDNMDGYNNETGVPLKYEDQLRYNIWLAEQAHARGLTIGLKNNSEQIADLLPYFDWALTEDCFAQGWCKDMQPFIEAGKPVYAAEYTDTGIELQKFCPQAKELGINVILKNRELDSFRETCP